MDQAQTGMYRPKSGCRGRLPRPPLCPLTQDSRNFASALLSQEEEEEAGEHPALCCYTAVSACVQEKRMTAESSSKPSRSHRQVQETEGCEDAMCQAADALWATSSPADPSGIPSTSGLARQGPEASFTQWSETALDADPAEISQHLMDGHRWEGPGMETQGCVCVYGQREPEGLGPCWPGSPYIYYGVRRNLVVGVEVVEEVAVEDTVEVITEDIYADHLLDPELLLHEQLYPT